MLMARAPAQPQERSPTETSPWVDPVELSTHCKSVHALVALGQQRIKKERRLLAPLTPMLVPRKRKSRAKSIIDVEIPLEGLRRFLVGVVFHHVEFAALLIDHRSRLDLTGALLDGRLVLSSSDLHMGLVQPLALWANHNSFALSHARDFLRLLVGCLRDCDRGEADHQTGGGC